MESSPEELAGYRRGVERIHGTWRAFLDKRSKRLPKAIQAILSNYRGTKVSSVPERDIPDVLVRLARAAMSLGRMPYQSGNTAAVYVQLEAVLRQLGRLDEVLGA